MKDRKKYIFYHNNCNDGFGAAYAAWRLYKDKATYIPINPNEGIPENVELADDSYVYILDIILEPYILKPLIKRMFKVVIIDHHQTNRDKLIGFEDNTIFDMTKSGAILSWEYFHPSKPIPKILKYIQDWDLWTKKLPHIEEVTAYINYVGRDFKKWDSIRKISKKDKVVENGKMLLGFKNEQIKLIIQHRKLVQFGDDMIYAVNSPIYRTELCDEILNLHPGMEVAMCYYDSSDGYRRFSLRSRGNIDVAKVAEQYGGGGHPKAAGFQLKIGTDNVEYKRRRGPYKSRNKNETQ